jgi:hypothetical protein
VLEHLELRQLQLLQDGLVEQRLLHELPWYL